MTASEATASPMPTGDASGSFPETRARIDSTGVIDEGSGELNNDGWSVDAGVILVPDGYVMPVVTEITSSRDPADPHFQDPMRYIAGLGIPEKTLGLNFHGLAWQDQGYANFGRKLYCLPI